MKDNRIININGNRNTNNNKEACKVAKSLTASGMVNLPNIECVLFGRCSAYFISFNFPNIL